MNFKEIEPHRDGTPNVNSGEYVLHLPTNKIVLCGGFSWAKETLNGWSQATGYVEGPYGDFQRIEFSQQEREEIHKKKSQCKGCKKYG